MAAAHRLVTPHPYRAMLMEASTGNWAAQAHRPMFQPFARRLQPKTRWAFGHLTPIPVLAQHSRLDEWIRFEGQYVLDARACAAQVTPELQAYDQTGASTNTLDSVIRLPRICAEIFSSHL